MILKVNNRKIDLFNEVNVTLKYDSVASTFSFAFQFNPDNPDHRAICKPCAYQDCIIEHEGEVLITGTMLSPEFIDEAEPGMVTLAGYSKTGVLQDSQIPLECYPLQSDNINLKNITERILKPFGLQLKVDSSVASKVNQNYVNSTGGDSQTVKAYLSELAGQRNIILTHDEKGNLVFTSVKAAQPAVFDFEKGMKGISYGLKVDGQKMHSSITVHREHGKKYEAGRESVKNPFVNKFRPKVIKQSTTDDLNTGLAARNVLNDELSGIELNVVIEGWELGGKIIRPNCLITCINPNVYLYKKTTFFVESVSYHLNESEKTAVLTCVLPEVYTGGTPKNIFE